MKPILLMAWRNLGRQRRRTALTVGAIAFAAAVLIFFRSTQKGSYDAMIDYSIRVSTGHLQIQYPGFEEEGDINLALDDPVAALAIADAAGNGSAASPVVRTGMLVAKGDQSFGALVMGVVPERAAKVSVLADVIREGEYLSGEDAGGVIIGDKLSRNLGAAVGDELVLMGQAADGATAAARVHVRGLFRTGMADLDRSVVVANLDAVRGWLALENRIHLVAIRLADAATIDATRATLADRLRESGMEAVVLRWNDINPGVEQMIDMDRSFGWLTYALLLMVVAFGVLNTFLMAAFERTREFGVMLALGVKPRLCAALLLVESQFTFALSYVAGLALGYAVTAYFMRAGIAFEGAKQIYEEFGAPSTLYPEFTWGIAAETAVFVWIVVAVVSLYPAWRVTRFTPVRALHHV